MGGGGGGGTQWIASSGDSLGGPIDILYWTRWSVSVQKTDFEAHIQRGDITDLIDLLKSS